MEPILDPEQRDLEESLLRAGREVGMSPELRMKTLATLGLGSAGAAAAVGAKTGALGWLSGKAGAVWTAGVVGALGLAGALTLSQSPNPESPSEGVQSGKSQSKVLDEPAETEESAVSGTEVVIPDSAVELSDLGEEPGEASAPEEDEAPRDGARSKPVRTQASQLREELSHISRVEAALRSGNQKRALSLLSEYRSRFPKRQLGLEAEVLTIQAMYESGSVSAASSRARQFLDRHPTSPLGARAKQYLRE